MDLRQLRTFRAVAELGSLSKASDRLRIAQPALSRQIKLLEHDLRTPLFIRHGRGMVVTEAGRMLFERTAGLMRQLEQAREDVLAASGAPSGRVVVGMVPTISGGLAGLVAQRVVELYPQVALRIFDAYGGFLIDLIHRGEIDMAVVYGPATQLHLNVETLRSDDLFAIAAPGQGISQLGSASFSDIAKRPLILPSHPHGLRALAEHAAAAADLTLHIPVEADSFQALVDIVAAGVGCTFLPYYAVRRHVEQGLLEAVPVSPPLSRQVVLALPSRQGSSAAVQVVADIVRAETRLL
ncbi:LysR family transcriptional regulator [Sphingosinicella rhizophila]|uniref:LysR substrate-binding domain-containing protein n=1 Tax=Sphingosinicella rhizophila TaxID=3050082 RepID=A0ABU3Q755_9SPHN|nr:LysR substrate-binding domain-containing protein [Sphingosinicella sp. GR2756]MDT9598780.1 LysR substrate-binding domain-containing protein [Sphingosinicella sp. GR2756]